MSKCKIRVKVIQGEDLVSTSFLGSTSYYCVVTVKSGDQERKEETTPADGSGAKFDHKSLFKDIDSLSHVTVALRDASDNSKLGAVQIPATKFNTEEKKIKLEDWFPLEEEPGMSGAPQGKLKLSIVIEGLSGDARAAMRAGDTGDPPPSGKKKKKKKKEAAEGAAAADAPVEAGAVGAALAAAAGSGEGGDAGEDASEKKGKKKKKKDKKEADDGAEAKVVKVNKLVVEVIRGKGLSAEDYSLMGPATSDPYVVLKCNGVEFTTQVKDATLEPVWNESTHFVVGGARGELEVSVFDHDLIGTDDLLGRVTINLSTVKTLAAQTGQDKQWYALTMPVEEGGTGAADKGELQLALDLMFDKRATAAEPAAADDSWSLFGGSAPANGSAPAAASSGGGGFLGGSRMVSGSMSFEQRKSQRARGGSKREFQSGSNSKGAAGKQGASSAEARKKAAAEAAKEQARLATLNSKIMSGDWQVQVHVVEVRDLKGEDLSGSCDPVVYMQVLDQKQNSSIKEQTRSAVYDEIFFFDFRNVGRDELSVGNLKVSVYDADTFTTSDMIGCYQFDLLGIYFRQDHELYKQWVALVDPTNDQDAGTQGYLKLSVTVLGPGDTQKVHDAVAERMEELKLEREGGGGGGLGKVLLPPQVHQELHFLVVTLYWAEHMQKMDDGALGIGEGIDAFVQVDFAGNPACCTSVVTERGPSNLKPFFEEECWLPVMLPAMSDVILVSVWDEDVTTNELYSYVTDLRFSQIRAAMLGVAGDKKGKKEKKKKGAAASGGVFGEGYKGEPRWVNLYGAPVDTENAEQAQTMNRYPSNQGSVYKGRLLMGVKVVHAEDLGKDSREQTISVEEIAKELPTSLLPETKSYTLRAFVLSAAEIPLFSLGSSTVRLKLTIGQHEIVFPDKTNKNGLLEWGNAIKEKSALVLPADPTQIPDVFLYLAVCDMMSSGDTNVCYAKWSAAELLDGGMRRCPAKWHLLSGDPSLRGGRYGLEKGDFAGSVLMKIGLDTDEGASAVGWDDELDSSSEFDTVQARLHIYQCRNLPAADDNGMIDPYLKIHFCGKTLQTPFRQHSCNPMYYRSLLFDTTLRLDRALAPEMIIEVWDNDAWDADDLVGVLRLPMTAATSTTAAKAGDSKLPTPKWYKFELDAGVEVGDNATHGHHHSSGGSGEGQPEVLLTLQLVGPLDDIGQQLPKAPALRPPCRRARVEMMVLGVRSMAPFMCMPINMPFVELSLQSPAQKEGGHASPAIVAGTELGDDDGFDHEGVEEDRQSTDPSNRPSGPEANFLQQIVFDIELPVDPLYCPPLQIKIFDSRLGGFQKPLVGSAAVALERRLPWSKEKPVKQIIGKVDHASGRRKSVAVSNIDAAKLAQAQKAKGGDAGAGKQNGAGDSGGASGGAAEAKEESSSDWVSQDFLQGRDWWIKEGQGATGGSGAELEDYLQRSPFESFPLFLGQGEDGYMLDGRRQVGLLKGTLSIKLLKEGSDGKEEAVQGKGGGGAASVDLSKLKTPLPYEVRLYVIKGSRLQPMDGSSLGGGKSDPFLKVTMQ
jgi:hypothetical protein